MSSSVDWQQRNNGDTQLHTAEAWKAYHYPISETSGYKSYTEEKYRKPIHGFNTIAGISIKQRYILIFRNRGKVNKIGFKFRKIFSNSARYLEPDTQAKHIRDKIW